MEKLRPDEARVALVLMLEWPSEWGDGNNWPGMKALAEVCNMSLARTRVAVRGMAARGLAELSYLYCEDRGVCGRGYFLCPDLAQAVSDSRARRRIARMAGWYRRRLSPEALHERMARDYHHSWFSYRPAAPQFCQHCGVMRQDASAPEATPEASGETQCIGMVPTAMQSQYFFRHLSTQPA